MGKSVGGIALLASVLLLAGCAGEPAPTPLKEAFAACSLGSNALVGLGDEDHSLVLDGKGEEDAGGLSYEKITCVLAEIEVPDATLARIDATRALDGVQTDEWDDYTITWSYHPDSGPKVIIEYEPEH